MTSSEKFNQVTVLKEKIGSQLNVLLRCKDRVQNSAAAEYIKSFSAVSSTQAFLSYIGLRLAGKFPGDLDVGKYLGIRSNFIPGMHSMTTAEKIIARSLNKYMKQKEDGLEDDQELDEPNLLKLVEEGLGATERDKSTERIAIYEADTNLEIAPIIPSKEEVLNQIDALKEKIGFQLNVLIECRYPVKEPKAVKYIKSFPAVSSTHKFLSYVSLKLVDDTFLEHADVGSFSGARNRFIPGFNEMLGEEKTVAKTLMDYKERLKKGIEGNVVISVPSPIQVPKIDVVENNKLAKELNIDKMHVGTVSLISVAIPVEAADQAAVLKGKIGSQLTILVRCKHPITEPKAIKYIRLFPNTASTHAFLSYVSLKLIDDTFLEGFNMGNYLGNRSNFIPSKYSMTAIERTIATALCEYMGQRRKGKEEKIVLSELKPLVARKAPKAVKKKKQVKGMATNEINTDLMKLPPIPEINETILKRIAAVTRGKDKIVRRIERNALLNELSLRGSSKDFCAEPSFLNKYKDLAGDREFPILAGERTHRNYSKERYTVYIKNVKIEKALNESKQLNDKVGDACDSITTNSENSWWNVGRKVGSVMPKTVLKDKKIQIKIKQHKAKIAALDAIEERRNKRN